MFPFYPPWKHQKIPGSMVFLVAIRWQHWLLAAFNIPSKINPSEANFSILHPLKNKKIRGNTGQGWVKNAWSDYNSAFSDSLIYFHLQQKITCSKSAIETLCVQFNNKGTNVFLLLNLDRHLFAVMAFYCLTKVQEKTSLLETRILVLEITRLEILFAYCSDHHSFLNSHLSNTNNLTLFHSFLLPV